MTYVALLRGINVSGTRKVPMKDLTALCTELGWRDVRTYIASGNVVFDSASKSPEKLRATLEKALLERFGFEVPTIVRTGEDIVRIARSRPFGEVLADTAKLHFVFYLSGAPDAARVAAMPLPTDGRTRLIPSGTEVFLHVPEGFGNTKFENTFIERHLRVVSTARNWNTAQKLAEMVEEAR